MSSSRRTKCPVSGKRRFRDAREAKSAIHNASYGRQKAAEDGVPCHRYERRCYACDECNAWHLTSWADPLTPREDCRASRTDGRTEPIRPSEWTNGAGPTAWSDISARELWAPGVWPGARPSDFMTPELRPGNRGVPLASALASLQRPPYVTSGRVA